MKNITVVFKYFKFLSLCIISLYTKLERIVIKKLGKARFHITFSEKFNGCSVRNFKL